MEGWCKGKPRIQGKLELGSTRNRIVFRTTEPVDRLELTFEEAMDLAKAIVERARQRMLIVPAAPEDLLAATSKVNGSRK